MNTIRTISDVLRDKADETKKGITFVENRRDVLVPYGRVHAEAVAAATRLAEAGIGPGDRVIFQVSENRGLIRAFWGCVYAGAGDAGPAAETTVGRATGPGSYKMTAAIAAATVASVAGKPVAPGCRDLVGHPRLLEPVLAFARDAGIHIETPHDNPTTGPLPAAAHCDTKEKEKR